MKFDVVQLESTGIDVIDGDRGKNYPHQNELLSTGFCLFLSAKNVTKSGFSFSETQFISRRKDALLNNGRLCRGDIVITTRGTVGNVALYSPQVPYENIRINSGMLIIRCANNISNQYLYQVLRSEWFQKQIMAVQSGSAQPQLPKSHFLKMNIPLPPLPIQEKIASILQLIDDKVMTNNAINNNLEQQAQAIFKSWFVDFEPFGGVQPPEMKFVPLQELCKVVTKGTTPTTLGKPFTSSGINFIKAESILDSHSIDSSKFAFIDEETNALLKRSIIKANDIVFTIAGTLGRFAMVDNSVLPANTNQAVAIIRPDENKVTPAYLYSFFIGNWHNEYYSKRIQQAVQANLSLTTIKSLPIAVLSNTTMNDYDELVSPLFALMKGNEEENRRLSELRDTLLPKLMSGELDVSDIDL